MSLSPCCSSPPLSSFSSCPLSRLFSIFQPSPFLSLLFSLYLLSFLSSLHFRILFSIFQQAPFPLLLILYQPLFLLPPRTHLPLYFMSSYVTVMYFYFPFLSLLSLYINVPSSLSHFTVVLWTFPIIPSPQASISSPSFFSYSFTFFLLFCFSHRIINDRMEK